jgi:hypothetical protein
MKFPAEIVLLNAGFRCVYECLSYDYVNWTDWCVRQLHSPRRPPIDPPNEKIPIRSVCIGRQKLGIWYSGWGNQCHECQRTRNDTEIVRGIRLGDVGLVTEFREQVLLLCSNKENLLLKPCFVHDMVGQSSVFSLWVVPSKETNEPFPRFPNRTLK